MIKRKYLYAFLTAIVLLTGCANVQTRQEWERVNAFAMERTGIETRWEQTDEDVKATETEVDKLLTDGLTEEDAVKIALLNNRKLQAFFEEIGVAKADLVQAGLFTNPNLLAVFRFPFGWGGTNIGADAVMNISDFWQIPLRKKVAATRLEAIMLQASGEMLNTVSEAKKAHFDIIALSAILEETLKLKRETEAWRDHIIYRQKFGFSSDLDIYSANAAVLEREAELARTGKELEVARARLNLVLGLSPEQFRYEVVGTLSPELLPLPDLETIIARSLSLRPDVQVAQLRVVDSRRALELEQKRIVRNVQAGLSYDRETEGVELFGPRIGVQLPIFDQNQAQIAKAEYRVRQAEKDLQAKIGSVREEVSAALERISLARKEASLVRDQIMPARKAAVEYAEKYFNAMQLNMLYLLDARQRLLDTQRRFIEVLHEQRSREIELERVLGGKMPGTAVEHKGH